MNTEEMSSEETVIYHNPRCSKSRQTLELLSSRGINPRVVRYLETPPTTDEIERLIDLLGVEPHALLRPKEQAYRETGLSRQSDRQAIVAAIAQHPILIERPIVVRGNRAVFGRPPENVLDLL